MKLTIKTRKTGIPTQQARETEAPWTDSLAMIDETFLLKLDKLGFQPNKQRRQRLHDWDSNPASKGDRGSMD